MTMRGDSVVNLDVREDVRGGREPFARIMEAVSQLKCDERLRLVVPFQPVPLFGVMAQRGFSHEARTLASGDWEVLFSRRSSSPPVPKKTSTPPPAPWGCELVAEVDARGLEPPQPMVVILEALASLAAGAEMRAHTDRRPMHLYALLEERGFTAETKEQHDRSFITIIRRA